MSHGGAKARTVALIVHDGRPEATALAAEAVAWLRARGHCVRLPRADAEATGLDADAVDPADLADGCDLAVSLGGDGTMLRTVSLVARARVPVLGVNLGTLGYLTAVEPDALLPALERVLGGDHGVEERTMLAVARRSGAAPGEPTTMLALNEAVVEKAVPGRGLRLSVSVNGAPFSRYVADGIIVATPTGSTAYAFSARGPIVSPTLAAFQVTPVSPHTAFDRTVVFGPADVVAVEVDAGSSGILSIDGQEVGRLDGGHAVDCAVAAVPARLVTVGPRDFYAILKAKFRLGEP